MLKKLLLLSLTVISSLLLIACGSEKETVDPNKIAMPISASPSDADYKSVQKQLSDAGFENVTTQKIEDLTLGIFTKDGEVEKVTVKGDVDTTPFEATIVSSKNVLASSTTTPSTTSIMLIASTS